ncbi:MAG: sn-glycerol-3-phosphate ABC transporter ATP-binding protein UgpC [Rubellimicrobium sp.]|nr:sn-glycerol-3-phosphate ABC transporter ATP-binding protein UgpC [Rubellimicrobium sp.]
MATVTLDQVRKSFGAHAVLHGIDLDVADGEFIVLVGPSGCGKSTLLRMIAGLETISDGEVVIGDEIVNDLPPKERNIAMVFQNYALYPHMRVAQNMGFSLRLARRPREEIDREVGRAARILDLEALLDRYPKELSGGQRQRVAMGRAIVRDPDVFLFDEPLSNLDAKLRVQMRAEIKALHQRLRTTTVYVTHDQIEAMTMADRIVVMRDGRIEQIGRPTELYDRPVNIFVATFIGSPAMNLVEGEIGERDGRKVLNVAHGAGTWDLPAAGGSLATGRKVTLGIRPEALFLAPEGAAATIIVTEPTGAETHVVMDIGGTHVTGVFRERIELEPGAEVRVIASPETYHLFDPATGNRIEIDAAT